MLTNPRATGSGSLSSKLFVCCLLSLVFLSAADDLQDLWLIAIVPFTGGIWDGGACMRVGAELMLEQINRQQAILPGHRLRIAWQDGRCDAYYSPFVLLQNLVDQIYYAYGSNHTDVNNDGTISTDESLLGLQIWNASKVSAPVGLLGGGCSAESMGLNMPAFAFHFPIVSPGSTTTALSDRASYPNFFRTIPPDSLTLKGCSVALEAWRVTAAYIVLGEASTFAVNVEYLLGLMGELNIEPLGEDLSSVLAGLKGSQMTEDSWAIAQSVVEAIRVTRARFVLVAEYELRVRLLVCAATSANVFGLVWLSGPTVASGFWARTTHMSVSGAEWCTADIVASSSVGLLQGSIGTWRRDEDMQLSCGNLTAGEFKTLYYTAQEVPIGSDVQSPLGWAVMPEGATSADAVCMYALALRELLLVRSVALADLQDRSKNAEFVEVLSNTDFEGLQGRVSFASGSGDPEGLTTFFQVQSGNMPCLGLACSSDVSWVQVGQKEPTSDYIDWFGKLALHYADEAWPTTGIAQYLTPSVDSLFPECEDGLAFSFLNRTCLGCSENYTYVSASKECQCSIGFFMGASTCEPCPQGSYGSSVGMSACSVCEAGTYAKNEALSACIRCPKGSYSDEVGASACTSCPNDLDTNGQGFTSAEDCQCNQGFFDSSSSSEEESSQGSLLSLRNSSSESSGSSETTVWSRSCTECGAGAVCSGFGAEPLAAPGYMLEAVYFDDAAEGAGVSIFRCGSTKICPGGGVATCADGREGLACARCRNGLAESSDGTCTPCDGSQMALAGSGVAILIILLAVVYVRSRRNLERLGKNNLSLMIAGAQFVGTLQIIAVVSMVDITWPEPLQSVLQAFQTISFDVDVTCVGQASALTLYLAKLALLPAGVAFVVLLHLLRNLKPIIESRTMDLQSLIAPLGTLASALFISLCVTVLAPFQCTQHPNKKWTLVKYEDQLCWVEDHYLMILLASLGTLFPIFFVAMTAQAIRLFPRKMAIGDTRFLSRFEFIFLRFKPEMRWISLLYMVRNLAISLTPIYPDAFVQLLGLYTIFSLCCILNSWLQPWKFPTHNSLEVVINFFFAAFAVVSLPFADLPSVNTWVGLLLVLLGCTVAATLFRVCLGVTKVTISRYRMRPKTYKLFLCHHKVAAGAVARLLKMALTELSVGKVFLDSDDLLDLSTLFATVSEEVETLVVLCTQEVWCRPWCLGEITTANMDGVPTKPVNLTLDRPNDHFIESIAENLDLTCLFEVGMRLTAVQDALRWFRHLHGVLYPELGTPSALAPLFRHLAPSSCSRTELSLSDSNSEQRQPTSGWSHMETQILLSCEGSNPNSVASAAILLKYIKLHDLRAISFHERLSNTQLEDTSNLNFQCLAAICTGGCWEDVEFILAFKLTSELRSLSLGVIVDDTFTVPSAGVLQRVESRLSTLGFEPAPVLDTIALTFKKIALPLSVMASISTIDAQSKAIAQRLKHMLSSGSADSNAVVQATSLCDLKSSLTGSRTPRRPERFAACDEMEEVSSV